jgi:hypothetical protein
MAFMRAPPFTEWLLYSSREGLEGQEEAEILGQMERVVLCALGAASCLMTAETTNAATPNELRVNGTIRASREYVELRGTPNECIGSLTFVSINPNGVIYNACLLAGQSFASDSEYFLFAQSTYGCAPDDPEFPGLGLGDSSAFTYPLVEGFSGTLDDDLDTNDDGTLDGSALNGVNDLDKIILVKRSEPGAGGVPRTSRHDEVGDGFHRLGTWQFLRVHVRNAERTWRWAPRRNRHVQRGVGRGSRQGLPAR